MKQARGESSSSILHLDSSSHAQNPCDETDFNSFRFYSIEVKEQIYWGEPAIVIFITDQSKKTILTIKNKKLEEAQFIARQTENFTATVSHEMKTPIDSVLFFSNRLHAFFNVLCSLCIALPQVKQA